MTKAVQDNSPHEEDVDLPYTHIILLNLLLPLAGSLRSEVCKVCLQVMVTKGIC